MTDAQAPVPVAAPRVMLLSVWCAPGAEWRARLLESDATPHDFASPFELVRFLAQPSPRTTGEGAKSLK